MAKGRKTGGRKKGSANKTTAAAKEVMQLVHAGIGGVPTMQAWAAENLTEFYKLWSKILPMDVKVDGEIRHGIVLLPPLSK